MTCKAVRSKGSADAAPCLDGARTTCVPRVGSEAVATGWHPRARATRRSPNPGKGTINPATRIYRADLLARSCKRNGRAGANMSAAARAILFSSSATCRSVWVLAFHRETEAPTVQSARRIYFTCSPIRSVPFRQHILCSRVARSDHASAFWCANVKQCRRLLKAECFASVEGS